SARTGPAGAGLPAAAYRSCVGLHRHGALGGDQSALRVAKAGLDDVEDHLAAAPALLGEGIADDRLDGEAVARGRRGAVVLVLLLGMEQEGDVDAQILENGVAGALQGVAPMIA